MTAPTEPPAVSPAASSPAGPSARTGWIVAAAIAAAATGVGLLDKHSELPIYLKAAARFVDGERVYRPEEPPAFTYPPFAVLPYPPLLAVPEGLRGPVYALANGVLTGLIALALFRLAAPPLGHLSVRTRRICAAAVAVLAGRFVLSPLEYQSNDLFVVAFAVAGVAGLAWNRGVLGGASLGLAAAFKATPLLFLPVLVWRRKFLPAAAFGVAMTAATVLPDLVSPAEAGRPWAVAWYEAFVAKVEVGGAPEAAGAWVRWNGLNQSLSGTLYRLATPIEGNGIDVFDVAIVPLSETSLKLVSLAAAAAVLGVVLFATWPRDERFVDETERRFRRLGEAGVVFAAMLLLSPMSSKQHFCVLVIPIAVAAVDVATRRRDPVVLAGLGLIGLCGSAGAKDLVGRVWGNYLQACGTITAATAVALCLAAYVVSTRRREGVGLEPLAGRTGAPSEIVGVAA